ncbi:hypothetical protein Tco_0629064, partial [Tanacetum coccineum]
KINSDSLNSEQTGVISKYDDDEEDFETKFPAIVFNASDTTSPCEPTVSPPNDSELDFRISCDESDDEDYTTIFDENSFSYKIISVNDLKTILENDDNNVASSPNTMIDHDLDYFNDIENKFPTIVYNDGLTSKSDLGNKTLNSTTSTDEFNFTNETSLSEYEEEIISRFNDLFDETQLEINDNDNNVGIVQLSKENEGEDRMLLFLIMNLYVPFGIPFDPKRYYKDGSQTNVAEAQDLAVNETNFKVSRVKVKIYPNSGNVRENLHNAMGNDSVARVFLLLSQLLTLGSTRMSGWALDFVEDKDEETDTDEETNEGESNGEDVGLKKFSTWEGDSDEEAVPDTKFKEEIPKTNVEEKQDENNKGHNVDDSLKYPPGYTPIDEKDATDEHSNKSNESKRASGECFQSTHEEEGVFGAKKSCLKNISKEDVAESICLGHFQKAEIPRLGGSILQLMDDLVKVTKQPKARSGEDLKMAKLTMSSTDHPTSNMEDAFSSNFLNYLPPASLDYIPTSPIKTYSISSNSFGIVPLISPTLSLFQDDPYNESFARLLY